MFVRPDERPYITAEMITGTSFTGTEREIKATVGGTGGGRFHPGRGVDPAGPGADDRGLGTHPPGVRVIDPPALHH